jgi:hypothetical protein
MCSIQDEEEDLHCGENAICHEIGSSADFVCICKSNFKVETNSDTDCMLDNDKEFEKIGNEQQDLGEINNIIKPPGMDQNYIQELERNRDLYGRKELRVGETCIIPSSDVDNILGGVNPEVVPCVLFAQCVSVSFLFHEYNICQCQQGYIETRRNKCSNYLSNDDEKLFLSSTTSCSRYFVTGQSTLVVFFSLIFAIFHNFL